MLTNVMPPSMPLFANTARACLKVAVVTETYLPEINGVAKSVCRLVEGLIALGHKVILFRPRQSRKDVAAAEPGFRECLMPSMPIPGYASLRLGMPAALRLYRAWKRERPHVVHVVTEGPLGLAAVLVAKRLGLPVTSGFHTNFDHYSQYYGLSWLSSAVSRYLRWFHNLTAETHVPTRQMQLHLKGTGYHTVEVVSRGVDCHLFSPARRSELLRRSWGVEASDVVVCHVGRLAAEKNIELVFRAFNAIRVAQPTARLVLVGDGPLRARLERRHRDVIFAGSRQGVLLAEHYASSDVLLFPSITETFGNVTLEGMASGLPVLAFDYAAALEVMDDGANGVRVPLGDDEAYVAAAVHLAAQPEWREQMGAAARERVRELDWECVTEGFANRLAEVATRVDVAADTLPIKALKRRGRQIPGRAQ